MEMVQLTHRIWMIEWLENAFMTHLKQVVRIYNFLAQSTQEVKTHSFIGDVFNGYK